MLPGLAHSRRPPLAQSLAHHKFQTPSGLKLGPEGVLLLGEYDGGVTRRLSSGLSRIARRETNEYGRDGRGADRGGL